MDQNNQNSQNKKNIDIKDINIEVFSYDQEAERRRLRAYKDILLGKKKDETSEETEKEDKK